MVQRRDTGVTRHTAGWIVLGAGLLGARLLAACLPGASVPAAVLREASSVDAWGHEAAHDENPTAAIDAARDSFPKLSIDINLADEAELSCIPGIGPALAKRIVQHRQRIGRFRTMAELDDVQGVGPKLARQLRGALQPLPETDSDILATDPARLVGRGIPLPFNEPLHD